MSAIPSLSVWSSIKIAYPGYFGRNRNETKSSASNAGSRRKLNQKSNSGSTPEVVHLRVPSPLWKRRENLFPSATCVCQNQRRRESRQGPDNVSCLSVPMQDTADMDEFDPSPANSCNKKCFEDVYHDVPCHCLGFDENYRDLDDDTEFDCIPSVKPWTSEELRLLHKRYHLVEDKAKKSTEKKKKNKRRIKITKSEQTTPKTPNRSSSSSDSYKSLSQNFCQKELDARELQVLTKTQFSNLNKCCGNSSERTVHRENSYFPVKETGRNYYETKLAELYMIELGIKR